MAKRNKKKTRFIFPVLYVVGFLGASIVGILGLSSFAYDVFNGIWAHILYIFFLSLLYITAFIQEASSCNTEDKVINFFIFIGGLIFLLLFMFFGGVFELIAIFFSATMIAVICLRYIMVLRKNPDTEKKPDFKQILSASSLLLFAMAEQMTVTYVNYMLMAWALIPAAVISTVAALVIVPLSDGFWAALYPTKVKSVLNAIAVGFIVFFVAWTHSYTAIGVINCAFDSEPTKAEYTVIDKNITSGQVKQFEVKVVMDKETEWIPVPASDYYEISKGDKVVIDYYGGALGFAYYSYRSKA